MSSLKMEEDGDSSNTEGVTSDGIIDIKILEPIEGWYEGEMLNGLPHGRGLFTYSDGTGRWEGIFENGMMNGLGYFYRTEEAQESIQNQTQLKIIADPNTIKGQN